MATLEERLQEDKKELEKVAADVARVVFSSANRIAIAEATKRQVPSGNAVILNETYQKNILADLIARLKAADRFMTDEYLNKLLLPMIFHIINNVHTADLSAEEVGALAGVANPELAQAIEDAYFPGEEGGTIEGRGLATAISQVIKQVKSKHQGVFLHKIRKQALGNNSQLQKSSVNAYMDRVKSCKKTIEDNPNIKAEEAGNLNPNCKDNFEFEVGRGNYGTFTFNHAKDFIVANKQIVEDLAYDLIYIGYSNVNDIIKSIILKTKNTIDQNLITQVANQKILEKDSILKERKANRDTAEQDLKDAAEQKKVYNSEDNQKQYAKAKAGVVFFEKCTIRDLADINNIVGSYDKSLPQSKICSSTFRSADYTIPSCVTKADMVRFCSDTDVQEYQDVLGHRFVESDFSGLGS